MKRKIQDIKFQFIQWDGTKKDGELISKKYPNVSVHNSGIYDGKELYFMSVPLLGDENILGMLFENEWVFNIGGRLYIMSGYKRKL